MLDIRCVFMGTPQIAATVLSSMLEALTNEQQKGIERQDKSNQSKGKDEGREPGE